MPSRSNTSLDTHISGQSNKPLSKPAHALAAEQVVQETSANSNDGLSSKEAQDRLQEYGPNELGDTAGVQPVKILIRQVANAMTLVLILAMAVSFAIQSWIEGGVVAGVIALNIVVGFIQEFNAEKTMDSLRSLSSPTANAVRDGNTVSVPTREVVPGDMVELKTGDTIPADVRLIEAVNFETDEALLTGESLPVSKSSDHIFDEVTGPGDRLNVAYSSSTVTKGRARGIVFATGMYTEIGSIAAALRTTQFRRRSVIRRPDGTAGLHRYAQAWGLTLSDAIGRFLGINVGTPLQKKLSRLAILLFFIAVICSIIVLAANDFSNEREVIIYAVATGLSMIPASLIVVLTITMAAGTKRMVERHVIVRKLDALEALGAVTDICSDKTGTLTQGKMVAKKAWIPAKGTYSVGTTGEPFNPTVGALSFDEASPSDSKSDPDEAESISYQDLLTDNAPLLEFLKVASLANLAHVHETAGEWKARGDPTEIAIQVFASRFDWNRAPLTSGDKPQWKQLAEFPFDSDVKKMSVIFEQVSSGKSYVFTKGAVERVLKSCTKIQMKESDDLIPVTESIRNDIIDQMNSIASLGLRCLALASKPYEDEISTEDIERDEIERDLIFRGLIGLYDPPRPETAGAVRECHEAGVDVRMVTGDHKETARAIAAQVGIIPRNMNMISAEVANAMVMTASEFDRLTDDQIDALPVLPLVIARCAPSTKVRMIEALHRRNKFAAMTGDGVNDSPSLKRADVGISMGETGSDVAKDASDIILTDDNFASIINAIEEGRRMFDNIQKFILHLLAQNVAQALILLIGLAFKDQRGLSVFPLSPVEILWVIMVTSGLPDMGLGFEVAAPDVMKRRPVSLKSGVFTWELLLDMVVYGIWVACLVLGAFSLVIWGWGDGTLGGSTAATGCNDSYSPECDLVFRARGTAFASLTWLSLFLAWEMLSFRRSFFAMIPPPSSSHETLGAFAARWIHSIWRNQFLFWAVCAGFITMFPLLYIPVINDKVFLHRGISWEWGIVFVVAGLFFVGVEAWKWAKRVFFRYRRVDDDDEATADWDSSNARFGAYLRSATASSMASSGSPTEEKV